MATATSISKGRHVGDYQSRPGATLITCLLVFVVPAISATPPFGQIDFQVIHPPHGQLAAQPAYFTIRTKDQWLDWWSAKITLPASLQIPSQPAESTAVRPPPPEIDFDHYSVLVASSGAKLGTGNSVAFIAIFRNPTGITASVEETAQRGSCVISTAVSIPVAIALIPRTDEPVKFHVSSAVAECSTIKTIDGQPP